MSVTELGKDLPQPAVLPIISNTPGCAGAERRIARITMRMNTDGLVIRINDTGESDRVVTLLTRDYGILRAFANGSKKVKSSLHSRTGLLCCSQFSIYKSRDSYIIDDAQDIDVFFGLREDIEKISLAQYFCELMLELAPEFEPAGDYLRLILNALHLLEKNKRSPLLIKAALELRLMCLAGYMPDLEGCCICGSTVSEQYFFNPEAGTVRCGGCSSGGLRISSGVLAAMRHSCSVGIDKVYNFTLPPEQLKILGNCTERYVIAQNRRSFKSLDFYKSIPQISNN